MLKPTSSIKNQLHGASLHPKFVFGVRTHMHSTRHPATTVHVPSFSASEHGLSHGPGQTARALSQETASTSSSPLSLPFPPSYFDASGRLMLKNLSFEELEQWVVSLGEAPGRAKQIWRWMYKSKLGFQRDWEGCRAEDVQNGFSAAFRAKVAPLASMDGGMELEEVYASQDGTRKLVFRVTVGPAKGSKVESVLIPVVREQGFKHRWTICVSSQCGCQLNCQHCFTGRMGLGQDLSAAQIVEQVATARRLLEEEDRDRDPSESASRALTNMVYMGQGEPMDNVESVLASIRIVNHPDGLHLGRNKISVSTVGILPALDTFLRQNVNGARLVVSLHATTDEVRDWIVPVNRRYNLQALTEFLREKFPKGGSDHVLIAYTLLSQINDTPDDARRLLHLLQGIECKVNCIVFNPFEGTIFTPSTPEATAAFRSIVIQGGLVCTVRDSRGDDSAAACGQLGSVDVQKGMSLPRMLTPPSRFRAVLGLQTASPDSADRDRSEAAD